MGFAVTVFESILSSVAFKRPFETPMLSKLAEVMAWVVAVYLVLRFADLLFRGSPGLYQRLPELHVLPGEPLFLVPVLIAGQPRPQARPPLLFLGSCSLLLAGSLYRFNAFLIGFNPGTGWHYFPAVPEILITLGIVAIELMAYLYFVKKFPVLPRC